MDDLGSCRKLTFEKLKDGSPKARYLDNIEKDIKQFKVKYWKQIVKE